MHALIIIGYFYCHIQTSFLHLCMCVYTICLINSFSHKKELVYNGYEEQYYFIPSIPRKIFQKSKH